MAKDTKSFLPKTLGGVKVPKKVRKGPLGELLATPDGLRLLAEEVARRKGQSEPSDAPREAPWPQLPAGKDGSAVPPG